MANSIEIEGLIEEKARLERMMHFDPSLEKRIQKVIDDTLRAVREGMVKEAQGLMSKDPREAYRSVRRSVYKQILGGQVNILKKRRAGALIDEDEIITSNRKQWWRRRGYKTGQMIRYQGSDRGFILRFANAGTSGRISTTMDAHPTYRKSVKDRPKYHYEGKGVRKPFKSSIIGYRGRMGLTKARNFFGGSKSRMEAELPTLSAEITRLLVEEFNK